MTHLLKVFVLFFIFSGDGYASADFEIFEKNFNEKLYFALNPEAKENASNLKLSGWAHYHRLGKQENLLCFPADFDPKRYVEMNPTLDFKKMSAEEHFLHVGFEDGLQYKPHRLVVFFHGLNKTGTSLKDDLLPFMKELSTQNLRFGPHRQLDDVEIFCPDAQEWGEDHGIWFPIPSNLYLQHFFPRLGPIIETCGKPFNYTYTQAFSLLEIGALFSLASGSFDKFQAYTRLYESILKPNISIFIEDRITFINQQIDKLLEERHLSSKHLIMAGYSFGGAVALSAAFQRPKSEECLAVLACNTLWLGSSVTSSPEYVVSCCGEKDRIVPYQLSQYTLSQLDTVTKHIHLTDPHAKHALFGGQLGRAQFEQLLPYLYKILEKKIPPTLKD